MHGRSDDILKAQEVIKPVEAGDLTKEELLWLVHFAKEAYDQDRVMADYWVREELHGRAQFWRFDKGLAITKITQDAGHKYMVFCGLMGPGSIWKLGKVYEALKVWARVQGCTRAMTSPANDIVLKWGQRIPGVRKVEILMEDLDE